MISRPDKRPTSLLAKRSFSPIIDAASRILILGTMPGEESLRRREYYGHPRNQFWRILADIYQVPLAETYPERVALLRQKQLAVWDVLQSCERQGSLDQAINAVDQPGRDNTAGRKDQALAADHRSVRVV